MIPQSCLLIVTKQFPVLPGEKDEVVNERMYGKALCRYLQARLPSTGINVPFFCSEDWGWWLKVERQGFTMSLCIYSDPEAKGDPQRYALRPSMTTARQWSWRRLKKIDVSRDMLDLMTAVERLFRRDSEIQAVTRHDDFPYGAIRAR
jgi:hypothetical protein